MPDSAWTPMTGGDAGGYEADFVSDGLHTGGLDPIGNVQWHPALPAYEPAQPDEFPPEQGLHGPFHWDTTRTDTFRLLFTTGVTPPDPSPVRQYCDRCGVDHVDTLVDSSHSPVVVPYGAPDHVWGYQYGYRDGNLYGKYQVRGTELKRMVRIRKYLDLATHPEEPLGPATWERRSIDRIIKGPHIHWLTSMRRFDCGTGLRKFGEEAVGEELVAMLKQAGATGTLLNDGGDFAEMVSAASRLEDPRFSVGSDEEGHVSVTLADNAGDGELREIGTAKMHHRKGGFMTLEKWKSASDD